MVFKTNDDPFSHAARFGCRIVEREPIGKGQVDNSGYEPPQVETTLNEGSGSSSVMFTIIVRSRNVEAII